jgi:prefoldin subunit 5
MTHIADRMDDDDKLIQLKSLYDEEKSLDEIYTFLNTNIEDYDGFIDEVYSSFEKMYLDAMQDYEENADSSL